jgi:hypothetical protein
MRDVFTVPVTVGCDARYTDAGPGRLHFYLLFLQEQIKGIII